MLIAPNDDSESGNELNINGGGVDDTADEDACDRFEEFTNEDFK